MIVSQQAADNIKLCVSAAAAAAARCRPLRRPPAAVVEAEPTVFAERITPMS